MSKAMVKNTGLPFNPFTATSMGIKFSLGLRKYSDMEGESRGVTFGKILLRIADKNRILGSVSGNFFINNRSVRIVIEKRTGRGFGIFDLLNPDQKPLVFKSLLIFSIFSIFILSTPCTLKEIVLHSSREFNMKSSFHHRFMAHGP